MEMAQVYLLNTPTNVLGLSVKQYQVLSDDAYEKRSTIKHWTYDTIREWFTTKSNLTTTRGGDFYGDQKINCLQALAWWATDLTFRGKQTVLDDFDDTMMADCIYEANFEHEDGKKDSDTKKPDKFSHSKWVAWEEMVYT